MADFVSDFWHWWIIVLTLGGIVAMFWLTMSNSSDERVGSTAEPTGHKWDEDLEEFNNPLPRWWLMMFYITLFFALGYYALYPAMGSFQGVLGWSSKQQYEDEMMAAEANLAPLYEGYAKQTVAELATNAEALRTGERLFVNYCSVCHGSDARGAKGFPNLRDNDWLWGGSPEAIEHTIMEGRNGNMPSWKAALGGDEGVEQVANHVLSLSGREHDAAKAAAGKAKFALCMGCHGPDGKGNQALGAPNLTDNTWLYGGSPKTIMKTIADGRSGRMPAHKDFLGANKSHLLAAYVYSLSNN